MSAQQRRNRLRGKAQERVTAKRLGGKRVGVMGGEDVEHELLSIECKSLKRFVGKGFMEQAKRHVPNGKIPTVVVHVTNCPRRDDLVILRMQDFEDLFGRIGSGEEDTYGEEA